MWTQTQREGEPHTFVVVVCVIDALSSDVVILLSALLYQIISIAVKDRSSQFNDRCMLCCCCNKNHLILPWLQTSLSCNPLIAASGETASASQVLPKGPVVRACWCALGAKPWVCPRANKWFCCQDQNLLEGMSRWFPSKIEIQKWIENQEKDFV